MIAPANRVSFTSDTRLPAQIRPSPNYGNRVGGKPADMLILHYTGMEDAQSALDRLCQPESEVSCHYVVLEDGGIVQIVPEAARAWHAGQSSWLGETDINSRSIGIEIVNPGHDFDYPDFPPVQIQAVIALCVDIGQRWTIPPRLVLAHSDVAPRRKIDPGEKFPWQVLHHAGIGHWVAPAPLMAGRGYSCGDEGQPVRALQALLAVYGYDLPITGVYDEATMIIVAAFQRHFRPALVDGVADPSTLRTLHDLIAALPAQA